MHSIFNSIQPEKLSERILLSLCCPNLRVIAPTECLEARDNIVLPYFHYKARSTDHLVKHKRVVRQYSFVEIEEIVGSCSIQKEGL
jgi:hypothetical protein